MPIYAYRCAECGHAKDVLQKISDPVLTTCPACGADAFRKQLTAAGFQLKGSGWYVTDFKGGNHGAANKPAEAKPGEAKPAESKPADGKPAESKPAEGKSADGGGSSSDGGGSAGAAPAGGCGSSCACH